MRRIKNLAATITIATIGLVGATGSIAATAVDHSPAQVQSSAPSVASGGLQALVDFAGTIAVPAHLASDVVADSTDAAASTSQKESSHYVASEATATSNRLALNGADIISIFVGGLALLAMGFLLFTFTRRRVQSTTL